MKLALGVAWAVAAIPFLAGSPAQAEVPPVTVMKIEGAIGPATAEYVRRGLSHAAESGAQLVVLRMDTPGGLDTSMRDIIKSILASSVPVATYVSPSGARAASAGTYILYASHFASMAPGTNLGAATPVRIGLPGTSEPGGSEEPQKAKQGARKGEQEAGGTAMERKQLNDAAAYIRGLAQLRGRNADWGERAVREAVSLTAAEALKQHVIDLIAVDTQDLLKQLDGRSVTAAGSTRVLATASATASAYDQDRRTQFLSVITDPSIALILMMIGVYGLFFEFMNPGFVAPGVIGAICLLLAMFAFQMLPVNYAGLALTLLGIALMVTEAFVPSFGVIGIGGIVSFTVGAVILIEPEVPGFGISFSVIVTMAVISALFVFAVAAIALRAHRRPVVSGREEMIGMTGQVVESSEHTGWAQVRGELWRISSTAPLEPGEHVRVVGIDGLTLRVAPNPAAAADRQEPASI